MEKSEHSPDWWLLFAAVAMLCVGVFIAFDLSYARAAMASMTGNDAFFYLKRQLIWAVLSIVALLIGMCVRYWRLRPVAADHRRRRRPRHDRFDSRDRD